MDPGKRQEAYRALEALYAELQAELDAMGPRCQLSGRCCRFGEFGHQLWVTTLEIDYLLEGAGFPAALPGGTCPFLKEGTCGARRHRALACRTFFCEPSFRYHMGPLHEKYHRRIKDLHRLAGIPCGYFEFMGELARRAATPP